MVYLPIYHAKTLINEYHLQEIALLLGKISRNKCYQQTDFVQENWFLFIAKQMYFWFKVQADIASHFGMLGYHICSDKQEKQNNALVNTETSHFIVMKLWD